MVEFNKKTISLRLNKAKRLSTKEFIERVEELQIKDKKKKY